MPVSDSPDGGDSHVRHPLPRVAAAPRVSSAVADHAHVFQSCLSFLCLIFDAEVFIQKGSQEHFFTVGL